jgi:hypothetical protein
MSKDTTTVFMEIYMVRVDNTKLGEFSHGE